MTCVRKIFTFKINQLIFLKMTEEVPKLTIHMVCSLDGFIAKKDGSISWLESTDKYDGGKTLTMEEIEEFNRSIDCYVMGSRTYEHAVELGWPYGDTQVIVLTRRDLKTEKENVQFYAGDLDDLVNQQLKPKYRNIWMVGGSITTKKFLKLKLADDLIVSIMPIILGEGILFFDSVEQEQRLHLKDVTAYNDGMVEMLYEINKN